MKDLKRYRVHREPTFVIYARVPASMRKPLVDYGHEHRMTLAATVAELITLGLEAKGKKVA